MSKAADQLKQIRTEALSALAAVTDQEQLEAWRVQYIGRRGVVPLLLRRVKEVPEEQRRSLGAAANQLRGELEEAYEQKRKIVVGKDSADAGYKILDTKYEILPGHLHPLTLAIRRIQNIFTALGFLVVEGPEVEEAKYNFDQLNIPLEHPARAETDTFYVADAAAHGIRGLVLRTHTSPVQLRAVLENHLVPPFRVLSPGRVFRAERTDATHETTFYQFEGLVVGGEVTIADFKGVTEVFYSTFFGSKVTSRLRPSYFPFVEPGFEVDISCVFCVGKGCRLCKQTGWIEVMGAGMVHPNVLHNMNVDPKRYQGYAFGGAVDRLAMLRHGIDDIRLFWSGNIRFLKQFG